MRMLKCFGKIIVLDLLLYNCLYCLIIGEEFVVLYFLGELV